MIGEYSSFWQPFAQLYAIIAYNWAKGSQKLKAVQLEVYSEMPSTVLSVGRLAHTPLRVPPLRSSGLRSTLLGQAPALRAGASVGRCRRFAWAPGWPGESSWCWASPRLSTEVAPGGLGRSEFAHMLGEASYFYAFHYPDLVMGDESAGVAAQTCEV